MKNKKLLILVVALLVVVLTISFAGCANNNSNGTNTGSEVEKPDEPKYDLVLKKSEFFTYTNAYSQGLVVGAFIDYELSDVITVVSGNEEVVKIKENRMYMIKPGVAEVQITCNDQTGLVTITVYSILNYYKHEMEANPESLDRKADYYACVCLLNNMQSFKDPYSVEVLKAWYHIADNSTIDYYMMEIRARNGFGGYSVDYVMVNASAIYKWFSPVGIGKFYRCAWSINEMLQEEFAR